MKREDNRIPVTRYGPFLTEGVTQIQIIEEGEGDTEERGGRLKQRGIVGHQ